MEWCHPSSVAGYEVRVGIGQAGNQRLIHSNYSILGRFQDYALPKLDYHTPTADSYPFYLNLFSLPARKSRLSLLTTTSSFLKSSLGSAAFWARLLGAYETHPPS